MALVDHAVQRHTHEYDDSHVKILLNLSTHVLLTPYTKSIRPDRQRFHEESGAQSPVLVTSKLRSVDSCDEFRGRRGSHFVNPLASDAIMDSAVRERWSRTGGR